MSWYTKRYRFSYNRQHYFCLELSNQHKKAENKNTKRVLTSILNPRSDNPLTLCPSSTGMFTLVRVGSIRFDESIKGRLRYTCSLILSQHTMIPNHQQWFVMTPFPTLSVSLVHYRNERRRPFEPDL